MDHLLDPIDDTSDKSESVDWENLTDQEKKEFNKQKELEQWNEDYISNLTFTGQRPDSQSHEEALLDNPLFKFLRQQRKEREKKLEKLKENGPLGPVFEDERGERSTLMGALGFELAQENPDGTVGRMHPDDKLQESSEEEPLPDSRDPDAMLEYMFKEILDMQRRNVDEQRFSNLEEHDVLESNRRSFVDGEQHSDPRQLADKAQAEYTAAYTRAEAVIGAPYVGRDGVEYRINCSTEEFDEQHGIYHLPLPSPQDFHFAEWSEKKRRQQYTPGVEPETALEAWEMFKAKDLQGFDTICLRHKRWGTEIEFFIGGRGKFKMRPSPLHQITTVEVDGSWFEWQPGYEKWEAPHIFSYLWSRHNLTDIEANKWREGGLDWVEAMGGCDGYLFQEQPARAPQGAVPIDLVALASEAGWLPTQDRWADWDLFNTTYIRPSDSCYAAIPSSTSRARDSSSNSRAREEGPLVRRACPPLQGSWRARVVGSRVVWTNLHSLCELHLTGEGFFFLSDWDRWRSARPQAVLVEYGLAGCRDGVNVLRTLSNKQARDLLFLPRPRAAALAALRKAAEADANSLEAKLLAWTEEHGWHDLKRRLFDRGKTADEVFYDMMKESRRIFEQAAAVGKELPYTDLDRHIYTMEQDPRGKSKRIMQLVGVEDFGLPQQIVDVKTRAVVWDRDQGMTLQFAWASEGLRIQRLQSTAMQEEEGGGGRAEGGGEPGKGEGGEKGMCGMRWHSSEAAAREESRELKEWRRWWKWKRGQRTGEVGVASGGGVTQIFEKCSGRLLMEIFDG